MLPELTAKQQSFLLRYFSNGENASEAYRFAFNSKAKDKTVWEESSKLLKNPKVTPWVEHYRKNQQQVIEEEIKYTALDAMKEYDDIKDRAKKRDALHVEKSIVDSKCKLAGLITDKKETKITGLTDLLDELQ